MSVDDLLMGIFNVYYSEYDGRYHNGRQADGVVPYEDVKPKLYSLLISKLPEKMKDRTGETPEGTTFHKADGSWVTANDFGYNSAISDMYSTLNELFGVPNE